MGETTDVAGTSGERQLQRGRLDANAESGAAPGVRGKHAVHAVQQEYWWTVPGRLGEQAVHQSVVYVAAAGQELSATFFVVVIAVAVTAVRTVEKKHHSSCDNSEETILFP